MNRRKNPHASGLDRPTRGRRKDGVTPGALPVPALRVDNHADYRIPWQPRQPPRRPRLSIVSRCTRAADTANSSPPAKRHNSQHVTRTRISGARRQRACLGSVVRNTSLLYEHTMPNQVWMTFARDGRETFPTCSIRSRRTPGPVPPRGGTGRTPAPTFLSGDRTWITR